MRKIIFLSLFAFVGAVAVQAEESRVFIRGVRPLAMGGAFTALADDQNSFFYNPAGITQRTGGMLSVFEMPITVGEDMLELYDYWDANGDDLENFDTLSNERQAQLMEEIENKISKLNPYFSIGLPNFSYISKPAKFSWGFGLFGEAGGNFAIRNGILVPYVDVAGSIDLVGIVPLAYKFDSFSIPFWKDKNISINNLSAGVNIKYINRANINETRVSVVELEEWDPMLQQGRGFGVDLGALYPLTDRIKLGLMVSDFLGTKISYDEESNDNGEIVLARDTVIPPAVNFGASYVPGIPLPLIKDRFILTADIRDIFDDEQKVFGETLYTKLHFGAEYRFGFLRARVGLNQGYPTIGAAVNLLALKVAYTYYTDELGKYAGQDPYGKNVISIGLKFGDSGGVNTLKTETAKPKAAVNEAAPKQVESVKPKVENQPAASEQVESVKPSVEAQQTSGEVDGNVTPKQ